MEYIKNRFWRYNNNWLKYCLNVLCLGAVLANIKSIFTDFDVDTEYALVTSYRMLRGDRMFMEMWEPHQTSAFLVTFLMWIYHLVIRSWTGVVVFLHCMGVLMQGALSMAIYKLLSKRTGSLAAAVMSIFFFAFRPKGIVFPEFSNMQIGLSILIFLSLLLFFENQLQYRWLIAASIFLCLQVLSYPSCLIVFFCVVFLLCLYTNKKIVNLFLFTIGCSLFGSIYVLHFVWKIGEQELISNVVNIINADGSHGDSAMTMAAYFTFLVRGCIWLAGCLLITVVIESIVWIYGRHKNKEYTKKQITNHGLIVFSTISLVSETAGALIYRDKFSYITMFLVILLFGKFGLKYCNVDERRIYTTGMILSGGSFLATIMLTNLDFLSVVAYLVLAVMVSFVPISRWLLANKVINVLVLFCAMVIIHRGLIVKTLDGVASNIFDMQNIVRSGPAVGVITPYMGAYEINCNIEDWAQFVRPGDNLLMVKSDVVNTMAYMYEDVTISIHSTISTPTYDEMLLEYWEENPDKFPNVIAVSCWYGDLHVDENSWIYQWIQQEFQPSTYADGRYWRFYRLEMEEQ